MLQGSGKTPMLEGRFVMRPVVRPGSAERLRSVGMAILGIVLAAVPLAIWVAWTEGMLALVLVVGTVSAGLLIILAGCGPSMPRWRANTARPPVCWASARAWCWRPWVRGCS